MKTAIVLGAALMMTSCFGGGGDGGEGQAKVKGEACPEEMWDAVFCEAGVLWVCGETSTWEAYECTGPRGCVTEGLYCEMGVDSGYFPFCDQGQKFAVGEPCIPWGPRGPMACSPDLSQVWLCNGTWAVVKECGAGDVCLDDPDSCLAKWCA